MIVLTDKQRAVIALVQTSIDSQKPFDANKAAEILKLTVNGVRDHLNRLKIAGVIDWKPKNLGTLKILAEVAERAPPALLGMVPVARSAPRDTAPILDRESIVSPALNTPRLIDTDQVKTIVDHVESMIAGGLATLRVIRDLPSAKHAMRAMMDRVLGESDTTAGVAYAPSGAVLGRVAEPVSMRIPSAAAKIATQAVTQAVAVEPAKREGFVVRNRHGEQLGPVYSGVHALFVAMKEWKRDRMADVVVNLETGASVTQPKHRTELRSDDAEDDPDEVEAKRDAELEEDEDEG